MKLKKYIAAASLAFLSACSLAPVKTPEKVPEKPASPVQEQVTLPSSSQEPNAAFADYLKRLVIAECEDSYITMHNYFREPEKYGIDPGKAEITLGWFVEPEDQIEEKNELEEELLTYTYEDLDQTQQDIYDQLKWNFDLSDKLNQDEFIYMPNIWSSLSGQQQTLVSFFSEYELRKEEDIAALITLIDDVPRYVKDALAYSKIQADHKLLMFDYDECMAFIQEVLDTRKDSAVEGELMLEVEALNLGKEKTEQYKEDIRKALNRSFFPGYELMKEGLEDLKDSVQPLKGLSSLENGREYYELLAAQATGTSHDPAYMKNAMNSMLARLIQEYSALPDIDYYQELETDFNSVEEIMEFLQESYKTAFPALDPMQYELQALADEQSQNGIVAYFLVPAIDGAGKYQIRYNKRDYGDDPRSLDLYTTLAHEGIPGHMYQTQFGRQYYTYDIQYMLSSMGYQEGYATYSQLQALKFLPLNKTRLQEYVLNESFNDFTVCKMDIDINYYGMSLNEFQKEYGSGTDSIYYQLCDNPTSFLSYYYGYYEILNLRNQALNELGDTFDDIEFNRSLLQAGSVNFDIVGRNITRYIERNEKEYE